MNGAPTLPYDPLSVDVLRRLDEVCLRFEEAWRSGGRPRLEEFLAGRQDVAAVTLLRELLQLELHYRRGLGELPSAGEYVTRFPAAPTIVEEVFGEQPAPDSSAFPNVPGYQILEKLGEGAMGVVYKARQRGLSRMVALKMILSGAQASEQEVQRFRFEAEAVAALDHPNIVQIHQVAECEGLPFVCLRYLEGGNLTAKLRTGPLTSKEAARLMVPVAQAVHHAHLRGILHRDLKPGNILLDAHGQPYVTDFGLARRVEGGSRLTQEGIIVGTPAYVSPEQALGKRGGVTTTTDVYGLGAILYELLTGKPPFEGESVMETLRQVIQKDVIPPGKLNKEVDPDLEAICVKCLQKKPANRYASAADLADDLDNFLCGRWVNARDFSLFHEVIRLVTGQYKILGFVGPMGPDFLKFAGFLLILYGIQNWLLISGAPEPLIWLSIFGLYLPLFFIFWRQHAQRFRPNIVGERHNWSLWIGHLLGTAVLLIAARYAPDLPGQEQPTPHQKILAMYPACAALTGTVLFMQGSVFWGPYYLFALGFFGLALFMLWTPEWAPLEFGVVASLVPLTVGLKLLCLTQQQKATRRVPTH